MSVSFNNSQKENLFPIRYSLIRHSYSTSLFGFYANTYAFTLAFTIRSSCLERLVLSFNRLISLKSQVTARTKYLPDLEATDVPSPISNPWKDAYHTVSSSGYALQVSTRAGLAFVDGDCAAKSGCVLCVLEVVVNTPMFTHQIIIHNHLPIKINKSLMKIIFNTSFNTLENP